MKITFKDCLARKRIFVFEEAKHLVDLEIKDAEDDLQSARQEFTNSGFKWATIKGYYAMFHSARALLYSKGYRERGHYCLYLAMKELFVKDGVLSDNLAEALQQSMILREDADYKRNFSEKNAVVVIERADKFLKDSKVILKID
ncbi:MAG: HEPN domain-containing protein [Candidatus Omnitrophica bacterium]|nr:HEPN domain-containing protein [Candidatus Omnitrophota bacterium]